MEEVQHASIVKLLFWLSFKVKHLYATQMTPLSIFYGTDLLLQHDRSDIRCDRDLIEVETSQVNEICCFSGIQRKVKASSEILKETIKQTSCYLLLREHVRHINYYQK
jgi:hypothetical protein